MSVWHSPEATMRTVTCPGPGSGTGRSSNTSGWPNWRTTAAFIVPPRSLESPRQPGRRGGGDVRGLGHSGRGPKVPPVLADRAGRGRRPARGPKCADRGTEVPPRRDLRLCCGSPAAREAGSNDKVFGRTAGPGRMQGGIEMRRRTFDALATMAGLVLAIVLAIGGGLLLWGHSVISNDVHTQLAAQKIVFPPANSAPIK